MFAFWLISFSFLYLFGEEKSWERLQSNCGSYLINVYGLEFQKIAYEYAVRRANLMLVARREHRLRGIAENARRMGARHVMIMAADVVKEDDCRRFINETIHAFGRCMYCCGLKLHQVLAPSTCIVHSAYFILIGGPSLCCNH